MQLWTSDRLRSEFLKFFEEREHKIFPASSLTNSGDPSVLLTTAGMQQFKPFYLDPSKADKEIGGRNTASSQKCFRTTDIDEVGDETHNTFFEMLGNFSFGGYFKKEAIVLAHEFITKILGLPISYVTIFEGLGRVPKDEESRRIWQGLGVRDIREEGIQDVFWGPTGENGPCGPTTEIYCKNGAGKDVEIWNIVFNEYMCDISRDLLLENPHSANLKELATKGIDTGLGLERVAMIAQLASTIFETDLFAPLIEIIKTNEKTNLPETLRVKARRIIADHMRGASFLMAEGLEPSNVKTGYILRRILRRAIRFSHTIDLPYETFGRLIKITGSIYKDIYPELSQNQKNIFQIFEKEYQVFGKTLKKGMNVFEKTVSKIRNKVFPGDKAFFLYATYGFPLELIGEMLKEHNLSLKKSEFEKALQAHKEVSKKT